MAHLGARALSKDVKDKTLEMLSQRQQPLLPAQEAESPRAQKVMSPRAHSNEEYLMNPTIVQKDAEWMSEDDKLRRCCRCCEMTLKVCWDVMSRNTRRLCSQADSVFPLDINVAQRDSVQARAWMSENQKVRRCFGCCKATVKACWDVVSRNTRALCRKTSAQLNKKDTPDKHLSAPKRHAFPQDLAKEWMLDDRNWWSCFACCKKKVQACWVVLQTQENYRPDVEDLVVGPAVLGAWISNIFTWVGFCIISVFAAFYTEIDKEAGIAKSLVGGTFGFRCIIVVWLLTTIPPLVSEFFSALYVIPAQVSVMGRPGILLGMGRGMLTFMQYLAVLLFISFILHTDIFTTAVFSGRVFKSTHSCKGRFKPWSLWWFLQSDRTSPLERMWSKAAEHSTILKGLRLDVLTFWQCTLISWIMMLFQFVYAILYAMPVSPDFKNEYSKRWCLRRCCRRYKLVDQKDTFYYEDVKHDSEHRGPHARRIAVYHTLWAASTSHGRCLQALADSGRMMSVQWLDDDYCSRASMKWELREVVRQMQRANWRFFAFSVQAVMWPSLQITFYTAQKCSIQTPHEHLVSDDWTFFSVCVTVVFGLKYLVWEIKTLWKASKRLAEVEKRDMKQTEDSRDTLKKWEILTWVGSGKCTMLIAAILSVMVICYFIWLALKGVMEIFWCNGGLWNAPWPLWPLSNLPNGCVPCGPQGPKHSVVNWQNWTGNWKECQLPPWLHHLANIE